MGRSGTSAITRVLSFCGAALPDQLLGPNEGNPTGHWEPLDALNLNEAFLARCGSSWYDPRSCPVSEAVLDSQEGRTFVDGIAAILEDRLTHPLSIIKEPRITALAEFWFAAAMRLGFRIGVVVAVRDPVEVASSLAARDGVPLELSNALWLKYSLLAEQRSRDIPRVFVEYPNLLSDWRREVDRVSEALAVDLSLRCDDEVGAFLSPDLRRHRATDWNGGSMSPSAIRQVYALLSMASRGVSFRGAELESLASAYQRSPDACTAVEQFCQRFQCGSSAASVSVSKDVQ